MSSKPMIHHCSTWKMLEDLCLERLGHLRDREVPSNTVYLDHAGAPPACKTLLETVFQELITSPFANPHTTGGINSDLSCDVVKEARALVLKHFGASSDEYLVVFTSGATAGMKLVGDAFPWSNKSSLLLSSNSHTSLLGLRSLVKRNSTESSSVNFKCFFSHDHYPAFLSSSCSDSSLNGLQSNLIEASIELKDRSCEFSDNSWEQGVVYHLIGLPGECNLSGAKLQLSVFLQDLDELRCKLDNCQQYLWLLDAAKLAGSSPICIRDLPVQGRPNFIVTSFYKIFGYPSGLGAVLIRKDTSSLLKKRYINWKSQPI
jgi:molybdenum cofactor sulfurtransferase